MSWPGCPSPPAPASSSACPAAAVPPADAITHPMQWTAAASAFAVTLFLWYGLSKRAADPKRAVLWAWCPLVALETGNGAHIDVVAVLLAAIALWLLARARTSRASAIGGAVLGLAIATKLTPALLLPAVLRKRPLPVTLGVVGAIGAVYLPHLIAVGPGVLGYLPGYLHEEGFGNGYRFALLSWVLPHSLAEPA